MANPAEVAYQTGRTVYYFRVSILSNQVYNTATHLYETYAPGSWLNYVNTASEILPGVYRGTVPAGSLETPATEYWYEQQAAVSASTDGPPIAAGNSQGVNIGTINGVQTALGTNVTADVQICNLALNHLGQKQITTLSDSTENARRCNLIYNTCRDEVLRDAAWKFATIIKALVDISGTTTLPVGWSYVYQYPTDAILIRKVFVDNGTIFDFPFFTSWPPNAFVLPVTNPEKQEFRTMYFSDLNTIGILSNLSPLYVEYTARMTNSGLYDAAFIKSLSYKLAAELADVLTGSPQKGQQMMQLYQFSLSEAARLNAIEDDVPNRNKSPYMDVR